MNVVVKGLMECPIKHLALDMLPEPYNEVKVGRVRRQKCQHDVQ
jgi:hypothetical protein